MSGDADAGLSTPLVDVGSLLEELVRSFDSSQSLLGGDPQSLVSGSQSFDSGHGAPTYVTRTSTYTDPVTGAAITTTTTTATSSSSTATDLNALGGSGGFGGIGGGGLSNAHGHGHGGGGVGVTRRTMTRTVRSSMLNNGGDGAPLFNTINVISANGNSNDYDNRNGNADTEINNSGVAVSLIDGNGNANDLPVMMPTMIPMSPRMSPMRSMGPMKPVTIMRSMSSMMDRMVSDMNNDMNSVMMDRSDPLFTSLLDRNDDPFAAMMDRGDKLGDGGNSDPFSGMMAAMMADMRRDMDRAMGIDIDLDSGSDDGLFTPQQSHMQQQQQQRGGGGNGARRIFTSLAHSQPPSQPQARPAAPVKSHDDDNDDDDDENDELRAAEDFGSAEEAAYFKALLATDDTSTVPPPPPAAASAKAAASQKTAARNAQSKSGKTATTATAAAAASKAGAAAPTYVRSDPRMIHGASNAAALTAAKAQLQAAITADSAGSSAVVLSTGASAGAVSAIEKLARAAKLRQLEAGLAALGGDDYEIDSAGRPWPKPGTTIAAQRQLEGGAESGDQQKQSEQRKQIGAPGADSISSSPGSGAGSGAGAGAGSGAVVSAGSAAGGSVPVLVGADGRPVSSLREITIDTSGDGEDIAAAIEATAAKLGKHYNVRRVAHAHPAAHTHFTVSADNLVPHGGHFHRQSETERDSGRILLGMLLVLVASQLALREWKRRARRSFDAAMLLGLWVIPAWFAVYLHYWRFLLAWAAFTAATARLVLKATSPAPSSALNIQEQDFGAEDEDKDDKDSKDKKDSFAAAGSSSGTAAAAAGTGTDTSVMAATTPRRVYQWFLRAFKVCYTAALAGWVLLLLHLSGLPLLFAALAFGPSALAHAALAPDASAADVAAAAAVAASGEMSWSSLLWLGDVGLHLIFYGLYFGVLSRDLAAVVTDTIAARIGYAPRALLAGRKVLRRVLPRRLRRGLLAPAPAADGGLRMRRRRAAAAAAAAAGASGGDGADSADAGGVGTWHQQHDDSDSDSDFDDDDNASNNNNSDNSVVEQVGLPAALAPNSDNGNGSGSGNGSGKPVLKDNTCAICDSALVTAATADGGRPRQIGGLVPRHGTHGGTHAAHGHRGRVDDDGEEDEDEDAAAVGENVGLVTTAATEAVYALPCGHVFHEFCLRGWLLVGKHDTCALCRAKCSLKETLAVDHPWELQSSAWGGILDIVRTIIVFNPVLVVMNWVLVIVY